MRKKILFIFTIIFVWCVSGKDSLSQDQLIKVWPGQTPGGIENRAYVEGLATDRPHRIVRVSEPTLSVYLPSEDRINGTAIVICPGGGYGRLAFDHEGFEVAEWLNSLGIVGIVVKYRLPSDEIMKNKTIGPLQDVQEAIRIVRRHAKQWSIDPDRVGVMGFSAGGHLAATASTLFNDLVYQLLDTIRARPDFSVLIYPVISMTEEITHGGSRRNLLGEDPEFSLVKHFSNEMQVTLETPPAFVVLSADDDAVPVENSIRYFQAMKKHGIPCELHIYEKGGHGYGLGGNNSTATAWPEALIAWLKSGGWL